MARRRDPGRSGRSAVNGDSDARPRLRDVAARAGVSAGTVSNVLNHSQTVAPDIRDRVQAAIEELNYVRNAAASSLRTGVSPLVGVAVLDIANPFFMEAARGMEERLSQDDTVMVLSSTHARADEERRLLAIFEAQSVRGILLTPAGRGLTAAREVARRGTRIVLFDSAAAPRGFSSVSVDDTAGAELAVRHLVELGHRRIAMINGPETVRQARERRRGAQSAVDAAGDDCIELLVHEVDSFTITAGRAGADWLLEHLSPRPSAIFCANDLLAIGVIATLRDREVDVPRDVSVIGFDDIPIVSQSVVPLSTVHQPMVELGRDAADLLLGSARVRHKKHSPSLVIRESTGPRRQ